MLCSAIQSSESVGDRRKGGQAQVLWDRIRDSNQEQGKGKDLAPEVERDLGAS